MTQEFHPIASTPTIPSWFTLPYQIAQERIAAEYPQALVKAASQGEDALRKLLEGYTERVEARTAELLAASGRPDDANEKLCVMEHIGEMNVLAFIPDEFQ